MRRLIPAVCMSTTRDTRIHPQILSRFARGNASVQQLFQTEDTFPDSRRTRSALISGHWPVHPPPFARGDKVHLADPSRMIPRSRVSSLRQQVRPASMRSRGRTVASLTGAEHPSTPTRRESGRYDAR